MRSIDESAVVLRGAVVLGDVTLGKDVGIWYNAVLRADHAPIIVGERSNIQDNCVVHVDVDTPTILGEGVNVGHGAILHGCSIGDYTMVGMGAIIMDKVQIGKNCIIGAGALVTTGSVIPDNSVVVGNPAKVVREAKQAEIDTTHLFVDAYVDEVRKAAQADEIS